MAFGYGHYSISVNKELVVGGVGAGVGAVQTVILQNLDSTGKLGAAPFPALGGFGTTTGLVSGFLGGGSLVLGLLGAMGHLPLKRSRTAQIGAVTYGATTLLAQAAATLLSTPAVLYPLALAQQQSGGTGGGGTGGGTGPGPGIVITPFGNAGDPPVVNQAARTAHIFSGH